MYTGKTLFAQIMDFLPWKSFHRLVSRYDGDHRVRTLPCAEQFRVLAFDDMPCSQTPGMPDTAAQNRDAG